ncbi:PBP1A family penicillin-binding protein [Patescibacteria group bacterium]|nr:PBP1A family penicillin-binding protein [Patescibacteria group bacterium]
MRKFLISHFRLIATIFALTILSLILFTLGTYFFYVKDLATADSLMNRNNTGIILSDRSGKVFYQSASAKEFNVVEIGNIPNNLKYATIAVEDKDFYHHPGFSIPSMTRAFFDDIISGSPTRYGASTITQQLVKNALLSPSKTYVRKFQELILAYEVERRYSKDQILDMYLNSIYYGAGTYGISEAAQTYFGKSINQLSLSDSALLAAIPQAPSYLSPFGGNLVSLLKRRDIVLTDMQQQGYISKIQESQAKEEKPVFIKPPVEKDSVEAPHFAVWVRDYLYKKYGEDEVNRAGFRVTTTLDLRLQNYAQEAVTAQVKRLAGQHVSNGGLVAINPNTGEILAMVGSYDWNNNDFGKYNVVFAKRQPGSSFKPIVYTKAFMDGMKSTDILHDVPTDFDGYKPLDYDRKFRGDVTLRRALANSLNIPAVELLQKVGVQNAIDLAQQMGITTLNDPSRYGLSLVLGGGEVELFQLTRAYGVLATEGKFVPSHFILSIEDKLGNTVYTFDPKTLEENDQFQSSNPLNILSVSEPFADQFIGGHGEKSVIDPASTYITTSILSDDAARSEEFGTGGPLHLSRPSAAKTGTTDDFRDSWTIGFTPNLVSGVWIGNNDNSPMDNIPGAIGAAVIWHQFMEEALTGTPVHNFTVPADIIQMNICSDDFQKACKSCTKSYQEVFKQGTQPENICPEDITPTPSLTPQPSDTPQPTAPPLPTSSPVPTPTIYPSPTPLPLPALPPISTPIPTAILPTIH